jgi:hypothetical protein
MGFLSPAYLFALAAVGVPVWLHLARRRKLVPVPFSSLRYLKRASARMRRRARVEDIALLLARCLLVALLALALARPVLSSRRSVFGLEWPRAVVVVVDATASMNWHGASGTRLSQAKRQAADWIGNLSPSDKVALWVLTDHLEKPVPEPVADHRLVLRALEEVKEGGGSSSLAPAFAAGREWAAGETRGARGMVVFTDNQPAAWDWPAAEFFAKSWPGKDMDLLVVQTDGERPPNLSVQPVRWSGNLARAGRTVNGSVRVDNKSSEAAGDVFELKISGQPVMRRTIELPPEGSLEIPLVLPVPATPGAVMTGEASLSGDGFGADDSWYFALPAQRTVKVVVVEHTAGAVGRVRPSFFLARALAAGGAATVDVVESDVMAKQSLGGVDALFATGGSLAAEAAWSKARRFAEAGGTLVVFGNQQPDPAPDGWPVGKAQEISLPPGRVATKLLVSGHPLFLGLWSEREAFPPLSQGTAIKAAPASGARVLATLAGELPLVVETSAGQGRIVWLNTSADRAWGDLPLSPVYVPLMQQLARLGELSSRAPTQRWVGEGWPVLNDPGAKWLAPDGQGNPLPRADRAGLHVARSAAGRELWQCAVNVRRDESDLRPLPAATLSGFLPGRMATGRAGMVASEQDAKRQVPLWPWLLAVAALIYLIESWWSVRAAARRAKSAGAPTIRPGAGVKPHAAREGRLPV